MASLVAFLGASVVFFLAAFGVTSDDLDMYLFGLGFIAAGLFFMRLEGFGYLPARHSQHRP